MTWLHIARIPGLDGHGAWLVVPGADDRILRWAINNATGVRALPSFGGWLVPFAHERALWNAIAATCGAGVICQQCLHGDVPCDAWLHLVSKRFEAARNAHALAKPSYAAPGAWRAPGYEPFDREPRRQDEPRYRSPPPRPKAPPAPPQPTREDRIRDAASVLGITWPATKEQISKAFKKAALRRHPDLGGSDREMREAIEARDVLLKA